MAKKKVSEAAELVSLMTSLDKSVAALQQAAGFEMSEVNDIETDLDDLEMRVRSTADAIGELSASANGLGATMTEIDERLGEIRERISGMVKEARKHLPKRPKRKGKKK